MARMDGNATNATIAIGAEFTVPRLGFGAMQLCGPRVMGYPADRDNALAVLRRTLELGVRLIDTADAYGPEVNERQICEALWVYPEDLLLATKGGNTRPGGAWIADGRPEHLRAAVTGSLQRLRLESVPLYQLHRPDPKVPFAESVGALAELRREGKIRYVGLSNVSVAQLETARAIVPIATVQNRFNLYDRSSEDVLQVCERHGIAFLPYRPIDPGEFPGDGVLANVAKAHGATRAQISLAWLLRRSPVIAPIPGTSSLVHLEENVAAAAIDLDDNEFEALAAKR